MVNTIDPAATRSRSHQVRLLWRHEHSRVHGARGVAAEPVMASVALGGARSRESEDVNPPSHQCGACSSGLGPGPLAGRAVPWALFSAAGAAFCVPAQDSPPTQPRVPTPLPSRDPEAGGSRVGGVLGQLFFLLPAVLRGRGQFTSRGWLL